MLNMCRVSQELYIKLTKHKVVKCPEGTDKWAPEFSFMRTKTRTKNN